MGGSSFVSGIISFSISHITTQLSEHEWNFTSSYIGVAAFPGVYFLLQNFKVLSNFVVL